MRVRWKFSTTLLKNAGALNPLKVTVEKLRVENSARHVFNRGVPKIIRDVRSFRIFRCSRDVARVAYKVMRIREVSSGCCTNDCTQEGGDDAIAVEFRVEYVTTMLCSGGITSTIS